jgi:hypothetical protein
LSHPTSPFFGVCDGLFNTGSHELFAQAGFDLCLLSSWAYRREPLAPSQKAILETGDSGSLYKDGGYLLRRQLAHISSAMIKTQSSTGTDS